MTSIHPATVDDLDAIAALEARTFGLDAWSPRSVEAEFDAIGQTREIVVARTDGRVSGYAILMYAGDTAEITRLAVEGDLRRRGVGTALLQELLDRAARHRLSQLLLEVAAENTPALALYAVSGFAEIDRRRGYYADGSDAVVMRRAVDGSSPNGRMEGGDRDG